MRFWLGSILVFVTYFLLSQSNLSLYCDGIKYEISSQSFTTSFLLDNPPPPNTSLSMGYIHLWHSLFQLQIRLVSFLSVTEKNTKKNETSLKIKTSDHDIIFFYCKVPM